MGWELIFAAIAAAVSGAAAYQNNRYQQASMMANAQANDYNASVDRQRAAEVQQAFSAKEDRQRQMNRIEAGRRAAIIAETGTGAGGSNAQLSDQSDLMSELDALNIRYEGDLESRGLRGQAGGEEYYGRANRANAAAMGSSIWLNTASSALSSGASAYQLSSGLRYGR